jgi:hypothetical protein
MGIHSRPVNEITDLNEQANIAGPGINVAQRIMDCGDAGHILLSQHVADDLEQYPRWRSLLHDLGECEVKHGVRVHALNLYADELGNPAAPEKFKRPTVEAAARHGVAERRRMSPILVAGVIICASAIGSFLFGTNRNRTLCGQLLQRFPKKALPFFRLKTGAAIPTTPILPTAYRMKS